MFFTLREIFCGVGENVSVAHQATKNAPCGALEFAEIRSIQRQIYGQENVKPEVLRIKMISVER